MRLQETLGTFTFLLEEVPHALQSHIVRVETIVEALGEVGVGGPLMQADQAVDSGLHLGGIIQMNLEAHGSPAIRI